MIPQFVAQAKAGEPQKLAVFGTSLSFHLAPILRDALADELNGQIQVVNAGNPGKASRTGLEVLEEKVLAHRPDALTLEFAVNDAHNYEHAPDSPDRGISPEESVANCERLIDFIQRELPACEIFLMTMNPAYDSPLSTSKCLSRRPQLLRYYEGYRSIAQRRNLPLIDNYAMWQRLRERDEMEFRHLIPDGVHPTPDAIREVLVPHLLRYWGITA